MHNYIDYLPVNCFLVDERVWDICFHRIEAKVEEFMNSLTEQEIIDEVNRFELRMTGIITRAQRKKALSRFRNGIMRMLITMRYTEYFLAISPQHRLEILSNFISKVRRSCNDNVTECPICLDSSFENRQVVLRHCQHIFHFDCIRRWVWSQFVSHREELYEFTGFTCPMCRTRID